MVENMDRQIENKLLSYETQLKNFYEIGKALSVEKDTFKLLDLIISNSIHLSGSDAGTIYLIVEADSGNLSFIKGDCRQNKLLKFSITKNLSMEVKFEESVSPITPQSICGYTAITGLPLKIADAYAIPTHEAYHHDKNYDLATGYRTKSILSIPMKTNEDKVLGVIQLINKKKPGTGTINYQDPTELDNIIHFEDSDESVLLSLAGQAAVVLENNLLYQDMEKLLQNYKQQNIQLQILSRNVLKAHEEERKRVAREIHDGPAQSVASLFLEVEICKKYLEMGDTGKLAQSLNDLNGNLKATTKEIRMIIYDLKPSYLEEGLFKALENHFNIFAANTGIEVKFSFAQPEIKLEYYLTSTLYRIVQEALTNIHKHANARNVTINIASGGNHLQLTIVDDGKGFDPAILQTMVQKQSDGGFGLEGMRERVELIKGSLTINSKPGEGAKIWIDIPLTNEKE